MSVDEAESWLEDVRVRNEAKGYVWYKNLYWELVTASCVLVRRNRRWFASVVGDFEQFWKRVLYYREHGDEWLEWKRTNAPVSRGRSASAIGQGPGSEEPSAGCILLGLRRMECTERAEETEQQQEGM
jgi:hypothetical protein